MFDLFALVGAIALIFGVLMLRGITALPFARMKASFVPAAPPTGSETLFEEAFAQLAALGFEAPRWVLVSRSDGEPATQPLRAVLRGPAGGLVWLGPPVAPRNPHRLFVYYSHHLRDGRIAISQPFDCFFASTQTDEMVARAAGELDFAAQWKAHLGWIGSLGSEPQVEDDEGILDVVSGAMERQRQALIGQGKLRAITDDVAVPKLRFALRLLRDYLRMPKPPLDPRPVPAGRLALLARTQELVRHRAPPRRTQWTLFAVSVAMFMVLGAVFWDVWIALGILLVVMIHELGHFLAMRAFGYRNVHVMALPLVGGVAMGVDANPAAVRQAWMSLMGPLPGIVFGWILLALVWTGQVPESLSGTMVGLASLFLLINYLNVLPVPPLDGAHVVQSLLPPRFARVQTLFTGVAAVIGAWFAWQFGLHLLALLALLQLPGLPASWRMHGAERELAADPSFSSLHRNARLQRVLQALERHLGPPTNAQQRINFASSLLTRSETAPMGVSARLATGTVYAGLLVVPVAALILFGGVMGAIADSGDSQFEAYEQQRDGLRTSARALSLDALLTQLSEAGAEPAAPAVESEFAAFEERLGQPMPQELRELYAVRNGLPALGLRDVESITTAQSLIDTDLAQYTDALSIGLDEGEDYAYVEIPFARARGWWHLGGDEDAPLFYLPEPDPNLPGKRVVSYFLESPSAYGSVREWLEENWVSSQESRAILERQTQAAAELRAAWADAPLETVLASFEPPSLILRWIADMPAWPDGADAATISAAEARLGLQFPPDYAELLRTHDGFPPLQLLSGDALARWDERRERMPADQLEYLFADGSDIENEPSPTGAGTALPTLSEELVSSCVLVAGTDTAGDGDDVWPRLVWCPETLPSTPWIDLQRRQAFPQFRTWLVEQAAPVAAVMKLAGEE